MGRPELTAREPHANLSRMLSKLLAPLPASALLLCVACSSNGGGPSGPPPSDPPRATTLVDVTYCAPDETTLAMDLYFPDVDPGVRVPVALFFHGGGWLVGTEDPQGSLWFSALREPLVERGFLVASAEYRLAPRHRWPAPIEDAKCAVRFLRSRTSAYGLDPEGIVAWGSSAGAHLAALLGTTEDGEFEGDGGHAGHSSRVGAVVDLWGPADLTDRRGWPLGTGAAFRAVFGTDDPGSPILAEASPVTHADPGDPPFLIVHGVDDDIVPVEQSIALREVLSSVGVDVELVVVDNAGHGLIHTLFAGPVTPSREEVAARILAFFEERAR